MSEAAQRSSERSTPTELTGYHVKASQGSITVELNDVVVGCGFRATPIIPLKVRRGNSYVASGVQCAPIDGFGARNEVKCAVVGELCVPYEAGGCKDLLTSQIRGKPLRFPATSACQDSPRRTEIIHSS